MISMRERPRTGRVLEIAIVVSILLHLLLGGFFGGRHPLVAKLLPRILPTPERREMAALSTAITIEHRTRPRVTPPQKAAQPARPTPPQPRVVPRMAAVPVPRAAVAPAPRPRATELAKIVPHAKLIQPKHVRQPHQPQKLSAQDIEAMEQRFAQTIAMARVNNDPTRVPPQQVTSTMKRAHLDIAGVNELMRRGEGILKPRDIFRSSDGTQTCYYVDYQIEFSDGTYDYGPVYWPICYRPREDPFALGWRGFPLPGPPAGWQATQAEWSVIAAHPLLRLYFPDKFRGN